MLVFYVKKKVERLLLNKKKVCWFLSAKKKLEDFYEKKQKVCWFFMAFALSDKNRRLI
ncbi:hypothetical protein HanIR_Chr15g0778621 [Helianthus annuus]|nr:hypothetical protein HanIR_Chr15g0778621 [Helianthus annuus]